VAPSDGQQDATPPGRRELGPGYRRCGADGRGQLSIDCAVARSRTVMAPAGFGGRPRRGAGADHSAALSLAGAGPLAGSAGRMQRTGRTPLMMRAGATPHVCHTQPEQIFRDRNSLPAERVKYPHPRNGLFLNDGYPAENL
jgi:hypothetical protein